MAREVRELDYVKPGRRVGLLHWCRMPAHPSPHPRIMSRPEPSWRAGKTTAQRGYGTRWQAYRIAFLRKHPLCARCKRLGYVTPANVVDHIKPHKGDQALFWNASNHESSCTPCHNGAKQIIERGGTVRRWGADGYPIDDEDGAGPISGQKSV